MRLGEKRSTRPRPGLELKSLESVLPKRNACLCGYIQAWCPYVCTNKFVHIFTYLYFTNISNNFRGNRSLPHAGYATHGIYCTHNLIRAGLCLPHTPHLTRHTSWIQDWAPHPRKAKREFACDYEKAIGNQPKSIGQSDFLSWAFDLERVENIRQKEMCKGVVHERVSQNEVALKQKG